MYSMALESGRGIEGEVRREADSTTQGAGTIRGQLRLRTSAAQHLRELSLRQPHDKRIAVRVHRTSDTEENGLGERKGWGMMLGALWCWDRLGGGAAQRNPHHARLPHG
jgi:hypothetical protein